jgi:dephospho-CoA kinase
MNLGITGGLGCGKTTAAKLFEKKGFRRLDADVLVREQVLAAPDVRQPLRTHFGPSVFTAEGVVNRKVLAAKVFADEGELRWLESLVHPRVFKLWRAELEGDPSSNWAVEIPLLFERNLENWFDFIVCVACDSDQQLVRLEQRGLNRALAGQRISKQLPLARKIELADFVLWNSGSAEFLEAQIDRLVSVLAPSAVLAPQAGSPSKTQT